MKPGVRPQFREAADHNPTAADRDTSDRLPSAMPQTLRTVVDSKLFQRSIVAVILLAGVLAGAETYPELVARHGALLHWLNAAVLWIFVAEIVLKMGAEGRSPWKFFYDSWNIFDFLIVVVCFLPLEAEYVAVLRLARLLRVLKLVTALPRLQILVGALLKSIPSMGYVSLLLSLLFYVYAVMGTFLFGANDPIHFGTLQISMLSLFRVVTLEDWTDIMYIQMYGSDSYDYPNHLGLAVEPAASPIFGALFFVSFVLLGTMIVLNLFIGIIMNGMDEARQDAEMEELARARHEQRVSMEDEIRVMHTQLSEIQQALLVLQRRITPSPFEAGNDSSGNGKGPSRGTSEGNQGMSVAIDLDQLVQPPQS